VGMSYLLDTHVVIWLIGGDPAPRARLLQRLEASDSRVLVSAVSAYELGTKVRLGKLDSAVELARTWPASVKRLGAVELDLTTEHAVRAAELAWEHRDPFDRLLVAQAQVDAHILVTADRTLLDAPDVEVLPW
jgi:PIN domain nuclease of toxin-antitoxin system